MVKLSSGTGKKFYGQSIEYGPVRSSKDYLLNINKCIKFGGRTNLYLKEEIVQNINRGQPAKFEKTSIYHVCHEINIEVKLY